jgi:hypothetical protein
MKDWKTVRLSGGGSFEAFESGEGVPVELNFEGKE